MPLPCALHLEAARLHGEEDCRAEQQQGDRRVGQQVGVEGAFPRRSGTSPAGTARRCSARTARAAIQPRVRLVRHPVAQAVVQADVDRILPSAALAMLAPRRSASRTERSRRLACQGSVDSLQGFEHARRRASGWRRRGRLQAQLPIGHAGGDQQEQENGEHRPRRPCSRRGVFISHPIGKARCFDKPPPAGGPQLLCGKPAAPKVWRATVRMC